MKDSKKLIPDWLWWGQWFAGFVCGMPAGMVLVEALRSAATV